MKVGIIMMLLLILATNVYVIWNMYRILPFTWLKIAGPVLYVLALVAFFAGFAGVFSQGTGMADFPCHRPYV